MTSARKRVQLADRRELAWGLYKRGRSFRQIGDELGYSKSSAQRDVQHVLAEVVARTVADAAEQRALDAARVEDVITAWYPAAAGLPAGRVEADETESAPTLIVELDRDAAEVFLKAVDQKGKILGYSRQEVALVTPSPLVVAGALDLSGYSEEELDGIVRNLSAAAGGRGD